MVEVVKMDRKWFLHKMVGMAAPVLDTAAKSELRKTMVVEQIPGHGRDRYAGLEAVARLLGGMAPWFEVEIKDIEEQKIRNEMAEKARVAINGQVDPNSPDFLDYVTHGEPFSQILVDAALLAQAILRALNALWAPLSQKTKDNVIKLLEAARKISPNVSNWLLFSVEIELLYRKLTGQCNKDMITKYFRLVNSWYFGDGWYGDGPHFVTNYYNSLIIHPFLLDLCDLAEDLLPVGIKGEVLTRAQRHAEVLENLVAPDGSFIAMGRSLTYRCGVYHLLAQLAWQKRLPNSISQATAREVLFAVTEKTLTPESYRDDGFLNIGINSHQPEFGETYVCTGSLYMAAAVFLPLGIPEEDSFWSSPAQQWTQRRIWS